MSVEYAAIEHTCKVAHYAVSCVQHVQGRQRAGRSIQPVVGKQ